MKPYKICETWIDLDAIFAINDTCYGGDGIVHLTSRAEPFTIRVWGPQNAVLPDEWQIDVDAQWAEFIIAWKNVAN